MNHSQRYNILLYSPNGSFIPSILFQTSTSIGVSEIPHKPEFLEVLCVESQFSVEKKFRLDRVNQAAWTQLFEYVSRYFFQILYSFCEMTVSETLLVILVLEYPCRLDSLLSMFTSNLKFYKSCRVWESGHFKLAH